MNILTPAPLGASSATEWLCMAAERLSDDSNVERLTQLSAMAFLAASLERQSMLSAPSAEALAPFAEAFKRVPSQPVYLPSTDPAFGWLQLSALAEFMGEPALARVIVDAVAALSGEHRPPRRLTPPHAAADETSRSEVLAICWCRRGRIARVAGALDDAQASFGEAITLVRNAPWRDARIAAELGLINIAIARGNYPQAQRHCTALLDNSTITLDPMHRVALYQMRAIAARKRGAALDALLDSWRAYDMLGHASEHRAELVVSMAETALDSGDLAAAMAGFRNARREAEDTHAQQRVQAAATTGFARTVTRCLSRPASQGAAVPVALVQEARTALTSLLRSALAPRERVYALITQAEWMLLDAAHADARSVLTSAQQLAVAHAFFDYQFRVDSLLDTLETAEQTITSSPSAPAAVDANADIRVAKPDAQVRHPALARLAALT